MDRPGVRQVPEGSGQHRKTEKTSWKVICGAPTIPMVKGQVMVKKTFFLDPCHYSTLTLTYTHMHTNMHAHTQAYTNDCHRKRREGSTLHHLVLNNVCHFRRKGVDTRSRNPGQNPSILRWYGTVSHSQDMSGPPLPHKQSLKNTQNTCTMSQHKHILCFVFL